MTTDEVILVILICILATGAYIAGLLSGGRPK